MLNFYWYYRQLQKTKNINKNKNKKKKRGGGIFLTGDSVKNEMLGPNSGGGALNFFQVGVCGPDFRSVGLANWHLPLKRGACERKISKFGGLWAEISKFGGLWAENFQIWGLVSWNLGENWGCWGYNFQIFSKGSLVNWLFCLKWDPCERQERREKGVFRAAHPHTPFLGQCPPGGPKGPA